MDDKSTTASKAYPLKPVLGFIYLGASDSSRSAELDEQFQPVFDHIKQARSRSYLDFYAFSTGAVNRPFATLRKKHLPLVVLHLNAQDKTFDQASWKRLLQHLKKPHTLRLVFLDGFARPDLIQALFEVGVPAVVATRGKKDDADYIRFVTDFYHNLLEGEKLKDALANASFGLRKKMEVEVPAWKIFTQKERKENLEQAGSDPESPLSPGIYLNNRATGLPTWKLYHPENQPEDCTFLKPLYPTHTRLHSDRWGEEDLLGYNSYARVIAGIINDQDSEPPLTVAIIAPWGYGKTTLMHFIRQRLLELSSDRQDHETGKRAGYQQIRTWIQEGVQNDPSHYHPKQRPMVWFNPWHYQSSEQVWSGMAHAIMTQLVDNLPQMEQEEFWFKLQYKRIDFQAIRRNIHKTILTRLSPNFFLVVLAMIALVIGSSIGMDVLEKGSGLVASGSIGHALWQWYLRRQKGMEEQYEQYLSVPNYTAELGLFHQVNEDLSQVFELLVSEKEPVVVFIDDLDRCSPEKVVEVTEAINLLINGDYRNKCYFVIGMDAQVVAAALDVAYRGMRGKLKDREEAVGSVGWYFLDKFIQLPFIIPSLKTLQKSNYLRHLFKPAEPEPIDKRSVIGKKAASAASPVKEADLMKQARHLLELSQRNEDRSNIDAIREEFQEYEEEIDNYILDLALESNKEESNRVYQAILQQLHIYASFLQPSPRSLKRFANMLRFHTSLQQLKDTKSADYASTESLAKWLTISLRWPQLVRWIQWEREADFVPHLGDAATGQDPQKLFLSKPLEKARILDQLVNQLPAVEELKEQSEKDDLYYQQWLPFAAANRNLSWLKDKELFYILYEKNQPAATLEKALEFNVW